MMISGRHMATKTELYMGAIVIFLYLFKETSKNFKVDSK